MKQNIADGKQIKIYENIKEKLGEGWIHRPPILSIKNMTPAPPMTPTAMPITRV